MNRKITSLLTLVMAFFVSFGAFAQSSDQETIKVDASLDGKQVTLGGAVAEIQADTWYFLYNGSRSGEIGKFLALDEVPTAGGVVTDKGVGADAIKCSVTDLMSAGVPKAFRASKVPGYLVRFNDVSEVGESEVYQIQFATGNYLDDELKVRASKFDAAKFNVYTIDPADPGKFGFNLYDMTKLVNNNGTNNKLAYWKTGKLETTDYQTLVDADTYNSVWNVLEANVEDLDELNMAKEEFTTTLEDYFDKFTSTTFNIGEAPGEYSQEAYDDIDKFFTDCYDFNVNDPKLTIEDIQAKTQEIIDKYNAFVNSYIRVTLANGYYRIQSALTWTNEVETGEKDGDGNPIKESRQVNKYIYSIAEGGKIYARWNTPKDESTFLPAIWKVTSVDGKFDIVNAHTQARFNNVARSTAEEMSVEDNENLMELDPVETTEDGSIVNIRVATQAKGDYFYLHAGGHSSGAGVAGNIVGWSSSYANSTCGGSEWKLMPVSDEDVQAATEAYDETLKREKMLAEYDSILTAAKENIKIAEAIETTVDETHPLISDASQFSSPYSQNDLGDADGQNLSDNPLLDGDISTFWHSYWGGGNVAMDTHYLQVEINDADVQYAAAVLTRRNVINDHPTAFNVRGTNEADAAKGDCELLASIDMPISKGGETVTSTTFPVKGYKYIRFYLKSSSTESGTANNRGYFHVAEFQLYPGEAQQAANAQQPHMGELFTNLQNVVTAQSILDEDDITEEHFNALKQAYDAFMTKFVNPAELRNLLSEHKDFAQSIRVGKDPGFFPENSDASAFVQKYQDAVAYDATGDYTPAQSTAFIEDLTSMVENTLSTANKIQEGKWYRIRFAYLDDFETYGWDKVAGNAAHNDNIDMDTDPALFGKCVAVAELKSEEVAYDDAGTEKKVTVRHIEDADMEKVSINHQLYFAEDNALVEKDAYLFRFINVGDTAFLLQNKATNLFLRAAGTSGAMTLNTQPSLFNVSALGYGLNAIHAESLTGVDQKYMHAQVTGNNLVTWGPSFEPYVGSRSSLYIEEIEDVAPDYTGTSFAMKAYPGELQVLCLPVDIKLPAGSQASMWSVNNATIDEEGIHLTMAKLTEVVPGRPFILVEGEYTAELDEEEREAASIMVGLEHGYTFTTEPQTGFFTGLFAAETVGAGVIIPEKNKLVMSTKSSTSVGGFRGYITLKGERFPESSFESEIEIIWDENAEDGIQTALANVSKSGAVYTIDGRLVSRKASLNDLSRFGKGMYILNGAKVIVK